jgi:hypothetical protein
VLGRDINDLPAAAHDFDWLGQLKQKQAEVSTSTEAHVEALRYVAHCYLQASYQASTNAEFKDRMRRAAEAFTQAALAVRMLPGEQAAIFEPRFYALALHCEAQVTKDDSAALDCLHRALDTLTNLPQSPDKLSVISPMIPLEYIYFTNDLTNYEPELSRRLPSLRIALSLANSAERYLPNLNDDLRATFLSEAVELQLNAWRNMPEYEQRETAGLKALELFEKLRTVVPHARDPRVAVSAFGLHIWLARPLPDQPLAINTNDLLKATEKTDDRCAIGSLLAATLRKRMYAFDEIEDPAEAKLSLSQGRLEANRASAELQAFACVRRFQNSSGYVNWTLADLLISYVILFAETLEERRNLVAEAVIVSRRIRELGPPLGVWPQHSNLGFYVFEQARLQKSLNEKRRLLDEAYQLGLKYETGSKQFAPYWLQGQAEHFIVYGRIKRERARLSTTAQEGILRESVEMFQKSADALEKRCQQPTCHRSCNETANACSHAVRTWQHANRTLPGDSRHETARFGADESSQKL